MDMLNQMVRDAETARAIAEDRDPDYENPAGISGVVLNEGENTPEIYTQTFDNQPVEEDPVEEESVEEDPEPEEAPVAKKK